MTPADLITHTSPEVVQYLTELEARLAPIEKAYSDYREHANEPAPQENANQE